MIVMVVSSSSASETTQSVAMGDRDLKKKTRATKHPKKHKKARELKKKPKKGTRKPHNKGKNKATKLM